MPLSWNEIKDRALKFSHEWVDESSEDAEAKSFWDAFFNVFGVARCRVATLYDGVRFCRFCVAIPNVLRFKESYRCGGLFFSASL